MIKNKFIILKIILILKMIVDCEAQSHPIVSTTEGPVLGQLEYSRNGRPYFEYLGIPYAKVPERYQPSVLPEKPKIEKLFRAIKRGPACIQYDVISGQVKGEEDCLYLNIFTPNVPLVDKNELIPVMVFLHSGGFMFSSSDEYRGKYFIDHDVILVTLNFRLGSFGYLNTQDSLTVGNLGLKDQVIALRWIQKNIGSFGGDPNLVTLFGDSSGAMSVHLHTLSPMSTGLFSRAISQSGTALCPFAFVRAPRVAAMRLGQMLNCSTKNTQNLITCLKSKSAEEIAIKHKDFIEFRIDPLSPFAPSMELNHNGEIFLSEPPYALLRKGKVVNKVPWMVGINSEECMYDAGLVLKSPKMIETINNDWTNISPVTLYFKEDTKDTKSVGDSLREYYFQDNSIDMSTQINLTNIYSDRFFGHCTRVGAYLHANISRAGPVYLFHLTYIGNSSIANVLGIHHYGVNMGDELQYLFNTDSYPEIDTESEFLEFSENLIRMWTSFARTGRPESTWGKAKVWPSINPELSIKNLQFYQVDKETKIVEQPGRERMEFWDELEPFDL